MVSSWDVFHSVRLEVDRGVDTEVVRSRLASGALNGDDLIRPTGTTRWSRINQVAEFASPGAAAVVEAPIPPPVPVEPPQVRLDPGPEPGLEPTADLDFFEEDQSTVEFRSPVEPTTAEPPVEPTTAEPPVLPDDEAGGPNPPELGDPVPPELETSDDGLDDESSDFTLSRNSADRVEELDLAAMVDVAFQLVLFFLVTASTVVFKTLEVPKPNEDKPPEAAAQSRAKSIDELEKDYILVEVDAEGAVKVDHLPVNSDRAALVERLRTARESTGRKAMLLSADFATRHKNAVLAFDVAGEIDLQIAIAQPSGKN